MVRRKSASTSEPLVNLLKSWSVQHKFQDDPYVSGLLGALESGENLEVWASLDPLDYLPTPSDKSNDIFQRIKPFIFTLDCVKRINLNCFQIKSFLESLLFFLRRL